MVFDLPSNLALVSISVTAGRSTKG